MFRITMSLITLLTLLTSFVIPALSYPSIPTNVPPTRQNTIPLSQRSAQEIINQLDLTPNPEKGYYVETFQDPDTINNSNRSVSTAIYYLYEGSAGPSNWHRVDAAEVWHYYAGVPLTMSLFSEDGGEDGSDDGQKASVRKMVLGPEIFSGQQPQVVVPKGEWQRVESRGRDGQGWTLVGTTVAPGFVENGFELAPQGWDPYGG